MFSFVDGQGAVQELVCELHTKLKYRGMDVMLSIRTGSIFILLSRVLQEIRYSLGIDDGVWLKHHGGDP